MSEIVRQAREYLANNAAESGANVLIHELCNEVERMKRRAEVEAARLDQAERSLNVVVSKLAFVTSIFPPDVKGPDGAVHTLKDETKLRHFEAMRKYLHREALSN